MTTKPKIITAYVIPPDRWCAWRDGDEETGVRGWGDTAQEAINDLLQQEE